MAIQVQCPFCRKSLEVADTAAGKNTRCPGCQTLVDIPVAQGSASGSGTLPASATNPYATSLDPFENPYAPTTLSREDTPSVAGADSAIAEAIRRKYLNHEASIQGMGRLYLLGGVLGFALGLFYAVTGTAVLSGTVPLGKMQRQDPTFFGASFIVLGLIVLTLSAVQLYAGWTMRKLDPKGKTYAVVVAAIGLLGFPCGTLIAVYTLYLLLSANGEYIYSPQYQQVVAATPHIKYRSIVVWVILGVLLLLVALLFLAAFLGSN